MSTTEQVQQYLANCDMSRARRALVARDLALSSSALGRRLVGEGTTFQALVVAEQKRRVLSMPRAYGKQMMDACGYTELNSFYRAFRKWFGIGYLEHRMARHVSTAERVANHLQSCDLSRAYLEQVALEIELRERTLWRRLAAEGTSFEELLTNERRRRVLADPGACGARHMQLCGYSHIQTFYRAFHKWFGQTYSQYKRSIQA